MRRRDTETISADRPLANPDGDELGYAATAKQLADRLVKAAAPDGFVVALNGRWGSGKTSLLNLILFFLREREEDERPLIVEFNPWWFSDREDLARRFFDALRSGLNIQRTERLRELLSSLGRLVSRVPIEKVRGAGEVMSWLADRPELSVPELKSMISEQLREFGRSIIVTIDDIDRLTFDEIRQIFRLIKAVGDFPTVVYVLAFDPKIVAKALAEPDSADGEDFIQKIVQVPVDLPDVDRSALNKMFFTKLDILAEGHDPALFDQQHWGNVFIDGIQPILLTPRDVTRLLNALQFTYPALKDDVNLADFVAVEAMRVFVPTVYNLVRSNPATFLRPFDNLSRNRDKQSIADLLRPAKVRESQQKAVEGIIERLFPKLSDTYGGGIETLWRKQGRICSPERFLLYFRLTFPREEISKFEISSLIDSASSRDEFASKLLKLSEEILPDGSSRVRVMLERIQDYTTDAIPLERISNIVAALLDVADILCREEDEHRGAFGFGNDFMITRILWQLLNRLDEEQRFEILREAMTKGSAIRMIASELASYESALEKESNETETEPKKRMVATEHFAELRAIVLNRIRQAASDGTLLKVRRLGGLLFRWRDFSSDLEVAKWLNITIEKDESLTVILTGFLQTGTSHAIGDRTAKPFYRLDPEWLRSFLDPDSIIVRCRDILATNDGLQPKQKIALARFVQEYEARAEGKDPDRA